MAEQTYGERRQSMCPHCAGSRGDAVEATATRGQVLVTYRCARCRHEWIVERVSASIFTERAADPCGE